MKITKEQLKNIVRETLQEESEYQTFFKKALEKAGKSIPSMSDEEKKAFFNKIEKTWKSRGQKSEGNAFGAAVAQAKKDGDDTFKVGDKEYKTERFGRGHEGPTFGSEEESIEESVINEISAKKGLEQVVKGNTKEVEGIKVSKEMAQAMLDWFKSSPYGRKYPKAQNARLHVSIGVMLSFGLDRYAKHKGAKEELKYLKSLKESVIKEGYSTEEKRIIMMAVRKLAKYRNVPLDYAINDLLGAGKELERDIKKGKIK